MLPLVAELKFDVEKLKFTVLEIKMSIFFLNLNDSQIIYEN